MRDPRRIAVRLRSAPLFALAALVVSNQGLVAQRSANAPAITGTVVVRVTADSNPIPGASIATGTANGVTDGSGLATFTLPIGRRTFRVTPAGFRPESLAVDVHAGLTNVTVAVHQKLVLPNGPAFATRDGRRISNEPTSVAVTDASDREEQVDRSPGSITELLSRVNGVRVQPLSAGSAGAAIRIRGMPGRYTKILSDGLPLFGSTPEGLEPLQLTALDLQRVEVIEGVTSALYGPTSLGGVVNVVSAPPTSPSEVAVNGTTREGSDVALWQTHMFSPQLGATLIAGRDYQNPADLDGDGWAEVNGYKRFVVRPRVYWSRSEQTTWFMTGGWTTENRRSGTFAGARLPNFKTYSDDADTRRGDVGTVGRIQLDSSSLLTIRASMTREWRTRWLGADRERDRRNEIFSDVALSKSLGDNVLVGGVAFDRDQFAALDTRGDSYRYTTPSVFAEHTWTPETWFGVTSSARLDLQSEFGDFVSPRMSVVVRPSELWTARLSAATGVYAPTPLTDESEAYGLGNVRRTAREAEHATGWSLDVSRVKGSLELRGSAYRTVVNHPLVLRGTGGEEEVELVNADEPMRTYGADLYARYRAHPLRFTATYSFVHTDRPEIAEIIGEDFEVDTTLRRPTPLTPQHSVNVEAAYERENDRTVAVELHFTGAQTLADTSYSVSRPYVTIDARLEKHIGPAILFVRGKNLTGVRQSQFVSVVRSASGPMGQWTRDVFAPLDGFVLNAGLRVKY